MRGPAVPSCLGPACVRHTSPCAPCRRRVPAGTRSRFWCRLVGGGQSFSTCLQVFWCSVVAFWVVAPSCDAFAHGQLVNSISGSSSGSVAHPEATPPASVSQTVMLAQASVRGSGGSSAASSSTHDGDSVNTDVELIQSDDGQDEDAMVQDVSLFRVCSQNVTSALRYVDSLAMTACNVLCVQETRLSDLTGKVYAKNMLKAHWHTVLGTSPPLDIRVNSVTEPTAAIASGVAMSTRNTGCAPHGHEHETIFGHRAQAARVAIPFLQLQLLVINVYGHAQTDARSRASKALLFQAVFDVGARWGSAPVVIAGDFNDVPQDDPVIKAALETGHWFDLAALAAAREGVAPAPTCYRTPGASPTRIDGLIGNRAAAAAMRRVGVLDLLLPTHRAVCADFSWSVLAEHGWAMPASSPLGLTKSQTVVVRPLIPAAKWASLCASSEGAALETWNLHGGRPVQPGGCGARYAWQGPEGVETQGAHPREDSATWRRGWLRARRHGAAPPHASDPAES